MYQGYVSGDINADEKSNIIDVMLALRYVYRYEAFTETQSKAADVNNSGTVDIVDVMLILRYTYGYIVNY